MCIRDRIIPEPLGAAHRDYNAMYSSLKSNIIEMINEVKAVPLPELLDSRASKISSYGQFESN